MAKFKIPKTLGGCADLLYITKQERLKAQKIVDALKANESALKAHIIDTLPKSNASGIAGKIARVTVVTKQIAQIKDWPKFYAYVKRYDAFDLLQKRLAQPAVKLRWEDGKKVAGVESFINVEVSMNKV